MSVELQMTWWPDALRNVPVRRNPKERNSRRAAKMKRRMSGLLALAALADLMASGQVEVPDKGLSLQLQKFDYINQNN